MFEIRLYQAANDSIPFEKWFSLLDAQVAMKIQAAVLRMEAENFGDHKSVGDGVWERRINFQKGYRIYYAKDGDRIVVLLGGGSKHHQQADIKRAKKY